MHPRTAAIKARLLDGQKPLAIARDLGISDRWVYKVAQRLNLPTNPTVHPYSSLHCEILQHFILTGNDHETTARRFNHSVSSLQGLLTLRPSPGGNRKSKSPPSNQTLPAEASL